MNDIALIKMMQRDGFTQKQARIVSGFSATRVYNIWTGKSHQSVSAGSYQNDELFDRRLYVLRTIQECKEIAGEGKLKDEDLAYIHLLKECQVPYLKVRGIYFDRTISELRVAYDNPTVSFLRFDAAKIGLTKEEYQDFCFQILAL